MSILVFHEVLVTCKSLRMNVVLMCEIYQLAFEVVVASALETSHSLCLCLLCSVSVRDDFAEVALALFCAELRHFRSAKSFSVFESHLRYIIPLNEERFLVSDNFAVEVRIYAVRNLSRICDSFNRDRDLVVTAVSSCKYAGYACHECLFIVCDRVLSRLVAFEYRCVYSLTYSQYHSVDRYRFCLSFYRYRPSSA